jgi:hypothetical protein
MTKRVSGFIVLLVGIVTGALLATAIPSLMGSQPITAGDLRRLGTDNVVPALAVVRSRDSSSSGRTDVDSRDDGRVGYVAGTAGAGQRSAFRSVTIPAGTPLRLTLDSSVASDTTRVEDGIRAHLASPVVVGGRTIVPANSRANGYVTSVRRSGKVKGRAYLAMRFTELTPAGDDARYRMTTRVWARQAPGTKKKDAVKIGVPAGVGALVGGIVGGNKGAGIGAAVGGGAGTGVVLATRGKEVRVPRGSTVVVRLAAPLTVRVRG